MLYAVNIFSSSSKPATWESTEGIAVREFQTPELKGPAETASEEVVLAASAERHLMGSLENVYIYSDGLGCIHAGLDEKNTKQLSKHVWQEVGTLWLRTEPIRKPESTWDERVVQQLAWWRRALHKLLNRTCGKCMYFDRAGADAWRTEVTHKFLNEQHEKMWDDVTKQAAIDHRAPDFQPREFGYCPKRDCGLASSLMACAEFKKR
jgi:hypothetical protein